MKSTLSLNFKFIYQFLLFGLLLLHLGLCVFFIQPFLFPDSETYLKPALDLMQFGKFDFESRRTWGYPLFLFLFSNTPYFLSAIVWLQHGLSWLSQVRVIRLFFIQHALKTSKMRSWFVFALVVLFALNERVYMYSHAILTESLMNTMLEWMFCSVVFAIYERKSVSTFSYFLLTFLIVLRPQAFPLAVSFWLFFILDEKNIYKKFLIVFVMLVGLMFNSYTSKGQKFLSLTLNLIYSPLDPDQKIVINNENRISTSDLNQVFKNYNRSYQQSSDNVPHINDTLYPAIEILEKKSGGKINLYNEILMKRFVELILNDPIQAVKISTLRVFYFWSHIDEDDGSIGSGFIPKVLGVSKSIRRNLNFIWILLIFIFLLIYKENRRLNFFLVTIVIGLVLYSVEISLLNEPIERYFFPVQSTIYLILLSLLMQKEYWK